jgi:hypothetical protein
MADLPQDLFEAVCELSLLTWVGRTQVAFCTAVFLLVQLQCA